MKYSLALIVVLSFLVGIKADPQAAENHKTHSHAHKASQHGAYAGQQARAIKSLSPDDIAELERGGGWGLAKAAELNGVPGPAHLLELKAEIALSDAQIAAVQSLYAGMKADAIEQGKRLIALEGELEQHFRDGTITDAILQSSLQSIASVRQRLRYIHLSTHLKTPAILSKPQITRYNTLRGY
ncbi:MAG: hypothetical protein HOH04_11225 [Rhodospirillaceae bacterium]|jgi:hypothetical protein|nr:hypothetical protein [Rhodospirillaceae bacterium]